MKSISSVLGTIPYMLSKTRIKFSKTMITLVSISTLAGSFYGCSQDNSNLRLAEAQAENKSNSRNLSYSTTLKLSEYYRDIAIHNKQSTKFRTFVSGNFFSEKTDLDYKQSDALATYGDGSFDLDTKSNTLTIKGLLKVRAISFPVKDLKIVEMTPLKFLESTCPDLRSSKLSFVSQVANSEILPRKVNESNLTIVKIEESNITLSLNCQYDNIDLKLFINIFSETPLFLMKKSTLQDLMPVSKHNISNAGFGTAFFHTGLANPDIQTPHIIKWDLSAPNARIVIEDRIPEVSAEMQETVRSALLAALASLKSFEPLAKRIVLASQAGKINESDYKISLSLGKMPFTFPTDPITGGASQVLAAGLADGVFQRKSGQRLGAKIIINQQDDFRSTLLKRYQGMVSKGLSQSAEAEFKALIKFTVVHELGHALGLAHNFAGYNLDSNGQYISIFSIMSYPALFIPPSIATHHGFGFGSHDINSLKYLYADLTEDPAKTRAEALKILKTLPFETDIPAGNAPINPLRQSFDHLKKALEFYGKSNLKIMQNFRQKHPDLTQGIFGLRSN